MVEYVYRDKSYSSLAKIRDEVCREHYHPRKMKHCACDGCPLQAESGNWHENYCWETTYIFPYPEAFMNRLNIKKRKVNSNVET